MTEIHKDNVSHEEWQKALDEIKVGDEYKVSSKTWWEWGNNTADK